MSLIRTNRLTTITGFKRPLSEAPDREANGGMDHYVWVDKHLVSTHRYGHWKPASCERIARQLGIVDGLSIKRHG